ncbi:FAD-binding oxidoreductase [uncultured Sphingomonas sp.]|uniref:NAD(P)/FAD-dependent oxidoreductase n=1 Tax=uncultured Sphingomonas sp. TaxID=158754 RepID=UPI0025FA4BE2|nr:FAD-binding oxidoreductase [uncultured Sphingomonas sp.]
MRVPLTPVESTPVLPAEADVVVIGGGIIGAFATYYLARRGLSVVLLEKGRIGAEQSSRNWGWCRQQNRDARELPMATKSLDLWEQFQAETGEDAGFRRCGLLYLSRDEAEIATWARWGQFARSVDVETHMLTAAQTAERSNGIDGAWKGGVWSPTDGTADPSRAAPAAARAAQRLGAAVVQDCAVRGLETSGGRLSAVVTERGTIRTRTAILSAGAWASSFCHQYGIRFPQATIRQAALSVGPGDGDLPPALHTSEVSATRRVDGSYTLAISGFGRVDPTPQLLRFSPQFIPMFLRRWRKLRPGGVQGARAGHETLGKWRLDRPTPMERTRILDPDPDPAAIRMTHERAVALMPALKGRPVTARWAGYVDSTPDGVPGIGEVETIPGFVIASGFSGHGFGIGPGVGHLLADMLTGVEPIVDPKPYHPDRFRESAWGKVADF